MTAEALTRALGEELRRRREKRGWTRLQFADRLPSGVTERTVCSYELGSRHLAFVRLVELCDTLEVPTPVVVSHALQRARICLANLALRIDLRRLENDRDDRFRPMAQWARNKLDKQSGGIAELTPSAVIALADFIGCSHHDLAGYLARFLPEDDGP